MAIIFLNCDSCPSREPIPDHFWVRFGLHFGVIFWAPFGGQFWPKHKENKGFWSFPALQKGLVLGPFLGSILDTFLAPFPVAFPGTDSRRPSQKKIIVFFSIELAQQPRAQKKVIRPYYLIQNYLFRLFQPGPEKNKTLFCHSL